MGKSILDLFKNKEYIFNQQSKAKTAEKQFDIRNSKDINASSSSPSLSIPFFLLNKLRSEKGERKKETFLEEELVGLRTLRGLASPIIYGTDIIRLKTETTPPVEEMKKANALGGLDTDANQSQLTSFGQQIKATRDEFNKFLGFPKVLYPTAIVDDLTSLKLNPWYGDVGGSTNEPYQVMSRLGEIKQDAKGTALGKFLKQTGGGTPQQIAKQAIGQSVKELKKAIRKKLLGRNAAITTNVAENELEDPNSQLRPYTSQENPIGGFENVAKIYDSYNKASKLLNSYLQTKLDIIGGPHGSKEYYRYFRGNESFPENPIENEAILKSNTPSYWSGRINYWTQDIPYTNNPTTITIGNSKNFKRAVNKASSVFNNTSSNDIPLRYIGGPNNLGQGLVEAGTDLKTGERKFINVSDLRPYFLKEKKKNDKIGYSYGDEAENKTYNKGTGNKITSAVNKRSLQLRGLDSNFDILNQTGEFRKEALENETINSYNGISLQDIDLIPLRFQRVNDYSAIYMRAAISNFQESFKPGWEGTNMLGNPFKFYTYTGVERTLSFDIQVYAMSQLELIMMWRRLEYLAKLTYPYSYKSGGIEPSIFYLTLGSLYVDKPAIITSLNYSLDDEKTIWETGEGNAIIKDDIFNPFSNINTNWDGIFLAGQDNKDKISYGGTSLSTALSDIKRSKITNPKEGYGYIADDNGLYLREEGEIGSTNGNKRTVWVTQIDSNGLNNATKMNKYKLPRYIKASLEITFLESPTQTIPSLYDYGKPITNTARPIKKTTPPPEPQEQTGTYATQQQSAEQRSIVEAAQVGVALGYLNMKQ